MKINNNNNNNNQLEPIHKISTIPIIPVSPIVQEKEYTCSKSSQARIPINLAYLIPAFYLSQVSNVIFVG